MTTFPFLADSMRFARHAATAVILGTLAVAGCSGDDDFVPGVPTHLALDQDTFTFTALGQRSLLLATATDGGGDPVDAALNWSTSDPDIVTVNGDGLATAIRPGQATVMVSYGSLSDEMEVTVSQTPARITVASGNNQAAAPSTALIAPLTVAVFDALGYRIPGVQVQFSTTSAGATINPTTPVTTIGDDFLQFGQASATMTLGAALGTYNARATVVGTALSADFTATARVPGPFDIEVVFVGGTPTPGQLDAFAQAEARWESIITASLPGDYADIPASSCGINSPALDRPIDDLIIFVDLSDIDGQGGILGGASVCFVHEDGLLPAIGQMVLDAADLGTIEQNGVLLPVITHEMGHVLGIGTLWGQSNFGDNGLLADPSLQGGTDPHFTGANALAAFDLVGGNTYPNAKVPVENTGGYGTADSHWRESVFNNELMTGYVAEGENPLSTVTIASLEDLGYAVDLSKADAFSILALLRAPSARTFKLHGDILPGPIKIINRQGKIVGTYRK